METEGQPVIYVGFWARFLAQIVDSILISLVMIPLVRSLYTHGVFNFDLLLNSPVDFLIRLSTVGSAGPLDFLVSYLLPAVVIIVFWTRREATPGKMLVSARVVDAATLDTIGTGKAIVRYLGYIVCIFTLGLGFLWVAIDSRKQGLHDKMAGTLVIRRKKT